MRCVQLTQSTSSQLTSKTKHGEAEIQGLSYCYSILIKGGCDRQADMSVEVGVQVEKK